MLPCPGNDWLVIEQRDEVRRQVSFSVFDFGNNQFLWRDVVLDEKWWLNLAGIVKDQIVLKVFENTDNPDKTSYIFLEVSNGKIAERSHQQPEWAHTNDALHPFQYLDGEADFETVKNFIGSERKLVPRLGVEYIEYEDYIVISYYVGDPSSLVNWLAVFNFEGECLYEEEIGTNLKGIGINTFFITSGSLFFVKNKTELVTFRIV